MKGHKDPFKGKIVGIRGGCESRTYPEKRKDSDHEAGSNAGGDKAEISS